MDDKFNASSDVYQLCCCCRELFCLKSLWEEYMWMGDTEVYGNMLKECFSIIWPQTDDAKDYICEVCITQLRNAIHFKQKVLEALARMKPHAVEVSAKIEPLPDGDEPLQVVFNDKDRVECDNMSDSDALSTKSEKILDEISDTFTDDGVEDPPHKETMKEDDIVSKKDTRIKPKKKRLVELDKKTMDYINPRQNVALILEHSTILPFKSSNGYFNCFYCPMKFVDFEQLKAHVYELHDNLSLKLILKCIHRPRDPVRADLSDINCRICKKKIDNLDFLIEHLTNEHDVKFIFDSDTKKFDHRILGYDLSDGKNRCYQCKKEFLFFRTLSCHMNEHSTDHVCDICGRCFLLADRLRAHHNSHDTDNVVKCEFCGKLCGSKTLYRSHVRYKHKKKAFMCSLCDKTFTTSHLRMQHFEQVHNRTPLNTTCRICSKKFERHKTLYSHMRSEHSNLNNERKHMCEVCGTKFKTRDGLSNHMVVHSGEKKFECEICHKKYGRRKTLIEHFRIHMDDRRWGCRACSQAFVQKCSLKNHVRVHHGAKYYEQLIIDKREDVK